MPRIPQRSSLLDHVVASVREAIEEGKWTDELPGELDLCAQLRVSRMTLRRALDVLERQRWIRRGGHGRRTVILKHPPKAPRPRGNEVRVLSGLPMQQIVGISRDAINELHFVLESEGFTFRFEYRPGLATASGEAAFRRLTKNQHVAGWIPLWAGPDVLQRFASTPGLPAMTIGSVPEGVDLHTVEFDARALGRHAGHQFLRHGYTRIIYVRPDNDFAGDLLCGLGLEEAAATRSGTAVSALSYSALHGDLRAKLESRLALNEGRLAFCVAQPNYVWPVVNTLLLSGRRIPHDAAVISRADDLFLETAAPSIARYRHDGRLLGRRAARLMVQLLRQSATRPQQPKLMPEFVKGDSLG
jgi:DNA-binding LacI/PurR family transcriptional regulator